MWIGLDDDDEEGGVADRIIRDEWVFNYCQTDDSIKEAVSLT